MEEDPHRGQDIHAVGFPTKTLYSFLEVGTVWIPLETLGTFIQVQSLSHAPTLNFNYFWFSTTIVKLGCPSLLDVCVANVQRLKNKLDIKRLPQELIHKIENHLPPLFNFIRKPDSPTNERTFVIRKSYNNAKQQQQQ